MQSVALICIDGPSGSGKGTLASMLARHFNYALLDSGAIYRITALAALEQGCDLNDQQALAAMIANLDIQFRAAEPGSTTQILLAGEDVTRRIRTEDVASAASSIAAIPEVRTALLALQRSFDQGRGLVADGRDMGTVVFPEAKVKLYLTASAEARAQRRFNQLQSAGESVSLAALLAEIQVRDERDMNRDVAPLKPASDAHCLDSTDLSIQDVFDQVVDIVEKTSL